MAMKGFPLWQELAEATWYLLVAVRGPKSAPLGQISPTVGCSMGSLVATRRLFCFRIFDVFWCHQGGFWGLWIKRLQTAQRSREAPLGSLRGSRRPPEGCQRGHRRGPERRRSAPGAGLAAKTPAILIRPPPKNHNFFFFHKNFFSSGRVFFLP